MNLIKFLLVNWDSILVVAVLLGSVIFLYKKGEIKILQKILFRLVTEAEREYGSGTGELKKTVVLEWIYGKLPAVIKLILSKNEIEGLIEDTLIYAKEKWATNLDLANYIAQKI